MKLSKAQRELLLKMHGGARVKAWQQPNYYSLIGSPQKISATARALVKLCYAYKTDFQSDGSGELVLNAAGRDLAEKIKEQA